MNRLQQEAMLTHYLRCVHEGESLIREYENRLFMREIGHASTDSEANRKYIENDIKRLKNSIAVIRRGTISFGEMYLELKEKIKREDEHHFDLVSNLTYTLDAIINKRIEADYIRSNENH